MSLQTSVSLVEVGSGDRTPWFVVASFFDVYVTSNYDIFSYSDRSAQYVRGLCVNSYYILGSRNIDILRTFYVV